MGVPNSAIALLARGVQANMDALVDRTIRSLREQVPGYGPDDGLTDTDIREVLSEYLNAALGELQGDAPSAVGQLETLMRARAEAGISLSAMLHSYRIGLSLVWDALAEQAQLNPGEIQVLVAATPSVFELLDRYSLRANAIHHEIALRNARRHEQIRATRLDTLLTGDSTLGTIFWDAVALLGIPRDGTFVVLEAVAVNQPQDHAAAPGPPPNLEPLMVSAPLVDNAWLRTGPRSQIGLIRIKDTQTLNLDRALAPALIDPGLRVGISSPFGAVADAGRARAQAHVACSAADAKRRIIRYNRDLLPVLLASAPDAATTIIAETLGAVLELPKDRRHALLHTVHVWLEQDQSVSATATILHCHRNTVNHRLRRFQELTDRQLSESAWRSQVLLALQAQEHLSSP